MIELLRAVTAGNQASPAAVEQIDIAVARKVEAVAIAANQAAGRGREIKTADRAAQQSMAGAGWARRHGAAPSLPTAGKQSWASSFQPAAIIARRPAPDVEDHRLSLSRAVPIRVSAIDARRARFTRSFRNTTPMMTAKTMPVSRKAETKASGARLSAHMTTQADP